MPAMSDEQFTRADWRPGKRRRSSPRVRDWGGRKSLPAALLGLGPTHGFGRGPQKRCKHCRRFAFKASGLCRHHLAGRVEMSLGRAYVCGTGRTARNAIIEAD
jgi:hypothetical protein